MTGRTRPKDKSQELLDRLREIAVRLEDLDESVRALSADLRSLKSVVQGNMGQAVMGQVLGSLFKGRR